MSHDQDGRTVHHDGTDYRILHNGPLGWGIYTGPNLDMVPAEGGGFAIGFDSASDAEAALTGTQPASQPTPEPTSGNIDDDADGM
jgi:hypothetical protein